MIHATIFEGNMPLMAGDFPDGTDNFMFQVPADLTLQKARLQLEFGDYVISLALGVSHQLTAGMTFYVNVDPGQSPRRKEPEEVVPVPDKTTVVRGLGQILAGVSEIEEEN